MILAFAIPARTAALEDLLTRAGASDKDYEAWQAERRSGITATQVRDLYLARQYGGNGAYLRKRQELIDIKLGRATDPFVDNKWTAWGRKREPIIAEAIAWAHGIEDEHRVFHHDTQTRWLASPDGIGVIGDELRVSEIKTSKTAIPLGSTALAKKGYVPQMVWQMLVTGARRCLYKWEQHNDDWVDVGGRFPEPSGILQSVEHWVEFDPELASELMGIATEFLHELDRQEAGDSPAPDPEDYEVLVATYLAAQKAVERAKERAAEVLAQIADRIGGQEGFKTKTSQASVTWVSPRPRVGFDEAAWAKRAPAQHRAWVAAKQKYVKQTPVAAYVKVTPVKDVEEEA